MYMPTNIIDNAKPKKLNSTINKKLHKASTPTIIIDKTFIIPNECVDLTQC